MPKIDKTSIKKYRNHPTLTIFKYENLNKYQCVFYVGQRFTKNGSIQKSLKTSNLRDAEQLAKKLYVDWKKEYEGKDTSKIIKDLTRDIANAYFASKIKQYKIREDKNVAYAKKEKSRLKLFAKGRRVGIILDESQVIKNPDSGLSAIYHELSGDFKRKIILTGTPIANRPFDIWSQIYFLDKGKSLGESFLDFKRNTDLTNDLHENIERKDDFVNSLSKINKKIKSFCFRETKKSSKINLPNKIYQNIDVILNPEQLDYYEKYRDELGGVLLINGIPEFDNAENLLKKMLRLVEIASNPFIFDNEYNHEPSKYQYLIDIIYNITSKSEKCIIWSNFIKNVEWLYRHLNEFNPVRIHGNLKIDDRNKFIKKFKSDKTCQLLVATPASLKEGFTLTVANHCVFYDRSFSLDDYLQAQDRIHRISQEKECYIYNLIAQNTIDIWIDELLGAKELASRLGQGDIDKGEYIRQANYDYGLMIRNILNLN